MTMAQAMQTLIQESGQSIRWIAGRAKVSPATICLFLSGKRMMNLGTADKIMAVLRAECELKRKPTT